VFALLRAFFVSRGRLFLSFLENAYEGRSLPTGTAKMYDLSLELATTLPSPSSVGVRM